MEKIIFGKNNYIDAFVKKCVNVFKKSELINYSIFQNEHTISSKGIYILNGQIEGLKYSQMSFATISIEGGENMKRTVLGEEKQNEKEWNGQENKKRKKEVIKEMTHEELEAFKRKRYEKFLDVLIDKSYVEEKKN